MGVPSLNDLAVDGTLNTTNQPTIFVEICTYITFQSAVRVRFHETGFSSRYPLAVYNRCNAFSMVFPWTRLTGRLWASRSRDISRAAMVKPLGKSEIQWRDVISELHLRTTFANAQRKERTWKHTETAGLNRPAKKPRSWKRRLKHRQLR